MKFREKHIPSSFLRAE